MSFDKRMKISNLVSISVGLVGIGESGPTDSTESKIPVEDTEKGTLSGWFAEGHEVEKERLNMGGFIEVEVISDDKEKVRNFKRKSLPEEDPDWSPQKGVCVGNSVSKRCGTDDRRSRLGGLDYSKPIIQAMPAPHSVKDLFKAFGWTVKRPERGTKPTYVSPSGSVYETLLKAVEALSLQAKLRAAKLGEKGRGSQQSMDGFSNCVNNGSGEKIVDNASSRKIVENASSLKASTSREKIAENEKANVSSGKIVENASSEKIAENEKGNASSGKIVENASSEKIAENEKANASSEKIVENAASHKASVSSEKIFKNASREKIFKNASSEKKMVQVVLALPAEMAPRETHWEAAFCKDKTKAWVKGEGQRGELGKQDCGNLDDCRNGKYNPVDTKFSKKVVDGEEDANKHTFTLPEDVPLQQLNTDKEKVKEGLLMQEEMEYGEAKKVAAVNVTSNLCMKGKCLNHEINSSNCSGVVWANNNGNKGEIPNDGEFEGVRRSSRIKGRHVAVDSELDFELFDGECVMFVGDYTMFDGDCTFHPPSSVDTEKPKVSPGKTESYNKKNNKETSRRPEKTRFREVNELLASSTPEEKTESGNCVEKSMLDMLSLKHEHDKENGGEASSVPEEIMDKEVLQVVKSSMPNEQVESCIKDDYFVEVKSVQSEDSNMDPAGMLLDVRRSTRINGRHVPVNDGEMDIGTWAVDDFICSSDDIFNEAAKKDEQPTLFSMNDIFERTSPRTDNVLLKQMSMEKSDFQEPRNQQQIENNATPSKYNNTEKVNNGLKTPDSIKCSPSEKKYGAKSLRTEKRCPSSASKRKSVGGGRSSKGKKKKKKRGGCGLIVRRSGKADYEEKLSSETKVNILSWLIDSGMLVENEKVAYKLKNSKGNILKGCVTRGGIRCNCCKKVLSLLDFEAHAGSDLRQPWSNICVISGMSLMQCQSVAWEKEKKYRKIGFQTVGGRDADPSDDTCGICADGGQLICCDGCPSTFHQDCVMLKSLPEGNWYCSFCVCAFCMLVDCGQDKCTETTNLLSCNQCGCKYHIDCVGKNDKDNVDSRSSTYCGKICEKVASGLSKRIGVSNSIERSFCWTLLRRLDEEEGVGSDQIDPFIIACNVKLSLALLVLHECFVPLVDPRTGLDMIAQAVYSCGSNFKRLNYEGFYTAILEKDDEIISVATLRLHGTRVAEMPFIGTRPRYRRKGMCRRLLSAIEELLSSLHVEKLIIPAIPDMLETWMKSFSFKHLEPSHKDEIRNLNMVVFAETTLLQKSIYNKETINARDVKLICTDSGLDIPSCCSPKHGNRSFKDAPMRLLEDIRTHDDIGDAEVSPYSEVSNGTAFQILRVQRHSESGVRPTESELVENVGGEVSVLPEIVLTPNAHVNR